MAGVDVSDALIKYYSVLLKTLKKSFSFDISLTLPVNTFILHKDLTIQRRERPTMQKAFRETLVLELTSAESPAPAVPHHRPEYFAEEGWKGRRRCMHCNLKTPIRCGACGVSLYFYAKRVCYSVWHTEQNM